MHYKKRLDMHTHTDNSSDGVHSTMYLCECAERAGLRAVAFTDHCEVDLYHQEHFDRSVMQSYFEIAKARSVYRGKLIVLEGIELGQAIYDRQLAEQIVDAFDYDVILASLHNLRGRPDFYYLDYAREDVPTLLRAYFDDLAETVRWGEFDVLAHLTYPLRYIVGEAGIPVDLRDYQEQIDTILRGLAAGGKALEINTSGLRQKIGKTMPDADVVRRFHELGGCYITVGADAHCAQDIGSGLEAGMQLAQECGFDTITLFQKRIPVCIPIE